MDELEKMRTKMDRIETILFRHRAVMELQDFIIQRFLAIAGRDPATRKAALRDLDNWTRDMRKAETQDNETAAIKALREAGNDELLSQIAAYRRALNGQPH